MGCPERWWKGSKHKPDSCGNFIFADFKEGGVSSHTVLSARPYSEGPHSFLHVEVLGLPPPPSLLWYKTSGISLVVR